MSNKTSIIAKIQEFLTLNTGLTTRAEHEEILFNSTDSVLEAVYSDHLTESTIGSEGTTITTSNANFVYRVNINKVGNNIFIEGFFAAKANLPASTTIFEFTDTDYNAVNTSGFAYNGNDNTIRINFFNNIFRTSTEVFDGEIFTFSTTYIASN